MRHSMMLVLQFIQTSAMASSLCIIHTPGSRDFATDW